MRWNDSLQQRFWAKVDCGDGEGCFEWTAFINRRGYGHFQVGGTVRRAHRVSWEMMNGPVPDGMSVLHRCDNRKCVRADHLFLGTAAENSADMVAKGRGPRGERQGGAKLTEDDVVDIRTICAFGARQKDIADAYGLTRGQVSTIISRKQWTHLP